MRVVVSDMDGEDKHCETLYGQHHLRYYVIPEPNETSTTSSTWDIIIPIFQIAEETEKLMKPPQLLLQPET